MLANTVDSADTAVDPHSVVNIQYTSGTTGHSKGDLLTHFNVVNNAWLTAKALSVTEEDRVCQTFPLYHTAGYTLSALMALLSGAAFVIPSRMFDAQATLQAIEAETVTVLCGVPSHEESAWRAVRSWLKMATSQSASIRLVGAQDDSMALGARKAFQEITNEAERSRWLSLPFTGCDGQPATFDCKASV